MKWYEERPCTRLTRFYRPLTLSICTLLLYIVVYCIHVAEEAVLSIKQAWLPCSSLRSLEFTKEGFFFDQNKAGATWETFSTE